MKMLLFHGRKDPSEEMSDWGFDGPILEGIEWVHVTYLWHPTIGFESQEAFDKAKELTGWDSWDELVLEARVHDDMIQTKDGYFGDWEFQK